MASASFDSRAKIALEFIRYRKDDEVSATLLSNQKRLERWEAVEALKTLAEEGLGQFIVGRRGAETRFLPDRQAISRFSAYSFDTPAPKVTSAELDAGFVQTYLLRRNPPVTVTVPADITNDEAAVLSKWLGVIAGANG